MPYIVKGHHDQPEVQDRVVPLLDNEYAKHLT